MIYLGHFELYIYIDITVTRQLALAEASRRDTEATPDRGISPRSRNQLLVLSLSLSVRINPLFSERQTYSKKGRAYLYHAYAKYFNRHSETQNSLAALYS